MPLDDPATSDDGSLPGDEVLAKARFHRVLLESLEKRAKKERKEGKNITDGEEKSDEKIRKEEKKRRKSKKGKSKDKAKSKKSKDDRSKKESSKDKKKKRKSKKKSKTLTVEVSDDDSKSGDSFKYWWSIDIEKEKETKKKKKKKSQIVSKLPKDKKRRGKLAAIESSIEFDAPSEATEPTERCSFSLSSSQQWSFSSEFVKKVSDDSVENSTKDTENTTEHSSLMWWDISEENTPSTPPTSQKKKCTQQLLSPCSDDSESDYDDVSIFSEESLSEEILDDLSCILDEDEAEDDSENDSEDEAATELKPSAELDASKSSAAKNSSDLDSSKKNSSDLDSSMYDSSSISSSGPNAKPTGEDADAADAKKKHLGGVKILSSRPSPYTPQSKPKVGIVEKYLQNITSPGAPTSSRSAGSKTSRARNTTLVSPFTSPLGTSNRTTSPKNSPKASPLSTSNRTRSPKNSPKASPLSTSNPMRSPRASPMIKRISMDGQVEEETLDGVKMVRRPGLFARRK